MRLPVLRSEETGALDFSRIDKPAATEMLRWAIDHGVNYVDTAYNYHEDASEQWLGEALADGYRERVKVATKMPAWKVERASDFDRFFNEQTERLGGTPDFYLLHSLTGESWRKVHGFGVLAWAERALAEGRFSAFGFSFHDEYPVFEEIVDAALGLWSFCQIQLNYMDTQHQAGLRGLEYAAERGLGVVVMEPIRGGQLAKEPPRVREIWDSASVRRSPSEWALQWVWDHPEVSLLLSGMSTLQQVQENVAAAERSEPGGLSAEERMLVARAHDAFRAGMVVSCTGCRYCSPCPQGVNIPRILEIYNDVHIYDDLRRQRLFYSWLDEAARADRCTGCGECEARCPQLLEVAEWLRRAHALLGAEEAEK